jgi:hypothetical protein
MLESEKTQGLNNKIKHPNKSYAFVNNGQKTIFSTLKSKNQHRTRRYVLKRFPKIYQEM